jgi:membrane-associated phospholipid phosphatase
MRGILTATPLRLWLIALVLTSLAVLACWAWVDRPLALWLHAHRWIAPGRAAFRPLTHIPDPLVPLGSGAFLVLGLSALAGRRLPKFGSSVVLCCLSVVTTETVKNGLKWAFGRAWPDSWRGSESSLVRDGDYGFHWFAGVESQNSFPSGHMAAAASVLAILWMYYPGTRPFCAGAALLIAAALVVSNFHFIGDVVAGAFLGMFVTRMTVALLDPRRVAGA